MVNLDRVLTNVQLCGVSIAFNGVTTASVLEGWQPFYNSLINEADFNKLYTALSSIQFSENSKETKAGPIYAQQVIFRFPNSDAYRADRIALLQKIKYVQLLQTNGLAILVGRNDITQNRRPAITITQNQQITEVKIESQSIMPSGYTPASSAFGLPALIPLNLIP